MVCVIKHIPSSYHTTSSTLTTPPSIQITHEAEETATMPHDSPLPVGHTPRSDESRLKHDELMELVTKLSDRVVAVEEDLKQTKKTYSTALTKLVLKVKKLEKQVRSGKAKRRARIEDVETQEKNSADTEVLLEEETPTELIKDLRSEVSTASHDVSTAAATLVYIRRSASKAKDKGKAIMQEPEPPKKLKKKVQVQMSVDEELSRKVQEEEQAKAMADQEQERINFEAGLELQRKLNEREEVLTKATQLQTIDWSDHAVLRYHALQNSPNFVTKVRKNMVMYLKNQAGYKQSYFKRMKYEEIRPIFEKVWDQTHTFVPMDSEDKEKGEKKIEESSKRQKNEDASSDYEQKKAELRLWLKVAQDDEEFVNPEILSTKYLIVDWEYQLLGQVGGKEFEVYKLTRADGSASYHGNIQAFLRRLDREDLSTLYRLINMLVEKKYPLIKDFLEKMLNLQLEAKEENTMAFELLKFIKSQIEEQ
ncbi:hypothetical protein Tco_1207010 [Tanacetum coccineum]